MPEFGSGAQRIVMFGGFGLEALGMQTRVSFDTNSGNATSRNAVGRGWQRA
jgi:hypothetical protein